MASNELAPPLWKRLADLGRGALSDSLGTEQAPGPVGNVSMTREDEKKSGGRGGLSR